MNHRNKKNKQFFAKKAVLVLTLASVLISSPAWAGSKSAVIQVSCSIKPMIEMTSASSVSANSNLDKQYLMTESQLDRGSQKIKLYSLTAL